MNQNQENWNQRTTPFVAGGNIQEPLFADAISESEKLFADMNEQSRKVNVHVAGPSWFERVVAVIRDLLIILVLLVAVGGMFLVGSALMDLSARLSTGVY